MPAISETTVELMQWVVPHHAGAPGQIHGGRMMQWIAEAGTLAASRLARGTVVLAGMDDIDFLQPVKVGEIAILRAQVESVGRTSLEVGVRVWSEHVATGARTVTLNSHLVFVSVDEAAHPRPVARSIEPRGDAEVALTEAARQRREQRRVRLADKAARAHDEPIDGDEDARWRFETVRVVLPEDALFGNMMFPGKMLMDIDEAGGILSMRYCRGFVMTACLDALDFYSPIWSHEVVTLRARLNHVGLSSLEAEVGVFAEKPWTGETRPACTAFLTYVHLGEDLRPRPAPAFSPEGPGERRRWEAALSRRDARLLRVKRLRAAIHYGAAGSASAGA